MFSAKINLYKSFTRLVKKNQLLTLDIAYQGTPFVNVVSSNQNNYTLDTVYNGQPFVGTPNNYIRRSLIGTNHPDVETWLNTLNLNGGTASSTTISALNTFCNSIDNAGLRRKFYRLNLFCGDNLNSCLVPLYVSSWWNEPVYGFSVDQNVNFVNSDYNETGANGGLQGNGGNKYLNTGVLPTSIIAGDRHLSVYQNTISTTDYSPLIGAGTTFNSGKLHMLGPYHIAAGTMQYMSGASLVNMPYATDNVGFWLGQDQSSTSSALYLNGSSVSSRTGSYSGIPDTTYTVFYTPGQGSEARLSSYSIGLKLTQPEITNFTNAIQAFQTALGRNV